MYVSNGSQSVKKGTVGFLEKALQNNGTVMSWEMTDEYEPD
jgi:hypothetical protein